MSKIYTSETQFLDIESSIESENELEEMGDNEQNQPSSKSLKKPKAK